jgi:hypothetical protein
VLLLLLLQVLLLPQLLLLLALLLLLLAAAVRPSCHQSGTPCSSESSKVNMSGWWCMYICDTAELLQLFLCWCTAAAGHCSLLLAVCACEP